MTTVVQEPRKWFCEKCTVNNNEDCGPWDETESMFEKCKQVHVNHKGWKIFDIIVEDKPTIQDSVNLVINSMKKAEEKEKQNDVLSELISLISKTVKGDEYLVRQILFNGFSAFTTKPTHLMVMEKSSEGKTYPALEIAKHFPKENVITLGSATPQSFKYEHGILVDKEYRPIQDRLDRLDEQIKEAKKSSSDKNGVIQLESQKKSLFSEANTLVDLRNKWIIFKEPPDKALLQGLYSTLSNDEEFNHHKFVNRSKNGGNENFTVIFRGCPALLVCTSKDESKSARWDETFTRFNTVSPTCSQLKYSQGMELIGLTNGLPKELYEEFVLGQKEKARITELVCKIIVLIQDARGEVLNPFGNCLSKEFPQEAGHRFRQYQRFNSFLSLHCYCYSNHRPKLLISDKKVPVITKADVITTLEWVKDSSVIPPNKMLWFREVFIPAYKKFGQTIPFSPSDIEMQVITGSEIVKYIQEIGKGKPTTKQIRETYLETLIDQGLIVRDRDPRNKTRDAYWPADGYDENSKSSLIATSLLDESCVRSYVEKYLKGRFNFEIYHQTLTQEETIPYILSEKNVIEEPENMPKSINNETTTDNEG